MILAASSLKADIHELTDYNFDYKINTRINLHDDNDIWMAPLTSLVEPCYLIVNKNYCDSNVVDDKYTDDTAAYIV